MHVRAGTSHYVESVVVVTGNGDFAYITDSGSVTGIRIAGNGVLSLLDADGATGQAGGAPIDSALSRNSRFLDVLNGADDSLRHWRSTGESQGSRRPLSLATRAGSALPPTPEGGDTHLMLLVS